MGCVVWSTMPRRARRRPGRPRTQSACCGRRSPRPVATASPASSSPTTRSLRRGPTGSCSSATVRSSTRPHPMTGPSRCWPTTAAHDHRADRTSGREGPERSQPGRPTRGYSVGVAAVQTGVATSGPDSRPARVRDGRHHGRPRDASNAAGLKPDPTFGTANTDPDRSPARTRSWPRTWPRSRASSAPST